MMIDKRVSWWPVAAFAIVLSSILAFLYSKGSGYDSAAHLQNIALLRQIKQLDAQWELSALKSKIGIHMDYDPLVDPLAKLEELQEQLEAIERNHEINQTAARLTAART